MTNWTGPTLSDADYERVAKMTEFWKEIALDLWESAEALWRVERERPSLAMQPRTPGRPEYLGPATMLIGLALENVLKGLLVAKGTQVVAPVKGGLKLSGELRTHDLLKLVDDAEISVEPNEGEDLEMIQRHVEWFGRYPVATKGAEMNHFETWAPDGLKNTAERIYRLALSLY